jgi:hypothetical protein
MLENCYPIIQYFSLFLLVVMQGGQPSRDVVLSIEDGQIVLVLEDGLAAELLR